MQELHFLRDLFFSKENGFYITVQPIHLLVLQLETINKMIMTTIAFRTIDWGTVERTEHKGETGTSFWKTVQIGGLRIRIVEYSAGYIADHWCRKGHIVQCLQGDFTSEMENGESFFLSEGMTYVVSDNLSSHKSVSKNGVKLLIIDGDFLS